jgi:hypothetical protein
VTGRWFTPGDPVSFTNKTDRPDISEVLLKVALNTIKQTNKHNLNANHSCLISEHLHKFIQINYPVSMLYKKY